MDKYERCANALMFDRNFSSGKIATFGLQFRKDKGTRDLINQRKKALKNGSMKIENEVSLLAIYLKGILKNL